MTTEAKVAILLPICRLLDIKHTFTGNCFRFFFYLLPPAPQRKLNPTLKRKTTKKEGKKEGKKTNTHHKTHLYIERTDPFTWSVSHLWLIHLYYFLEGTCFVNLVVFATILWRSITPNLEMIGNEEKLYP